MYTPAQIKVSDSTKEILKKNQGIRLDIGCGANKMPGFVGIDFLPLKDVDIVHDVLSFPWPLPNESVSVAVASHLVEHLQPFAPDPIQGKLIDLLIKKKILTIEEIKEFVGEYRPGPLFIRFMNEVWRVLQYDGEFGMVFPYSLSHGMYQDPTHINFINEDTWEYFDPLGPRAGGMLWHFYKPLPWKIKSSAHARNGNMEVVLTKRRIDKSYYPDNRKPLKEYLDAQTK